MREVSQQPRLTIDRLCPMFPQAVLEVAASEAFFHCGKSLIRSRIWEPSEWPDRPGLARLGAVLADQINSIDLAIAETWLLKASRSVCN